MIGLNQWYNKMKIHTVKHGWDIQKKNDRRNQGVKSKDNNI